MASKYGTFKFSYDITAYQPQSIKNKVITEKEARDEYRRMRKVIQSRAKSFERAGLTDTEQFREASSMPKLSEIKNRRELGKAMMDARRFLERKRSTVRGFKEVRRESVRKLNELGYDFITEKNIDAFGRFMDWFRKTHEGELYDSQQVVSVFNASVEHEKSINVIKKNFDYYYENVEDLDNIFARKK